MSASSTPAGDGIAWLKVNGEAVDVSNPVRGHVPIDRAWQAGNVVELELPLPVQVVTADDKVAATRGRVALRPGPMVYNNESVDQDVERPLGEEPRLTAAWEPNLLGGVATVRGSFADGSPLLAVPNYARPNRGGRSLVWLRRE